MKPISAIEEHRVAGENVPKASRLDAIAAILVEGVKGAERNATHSVVGGVIDEQAAGGIELNAVALNQVAAKEPTWAAIKDDAGILVASDSVSRGGARGRRETPNAIARCIYEYPRTLVGHG
jgi:hypothetical protein